MPTSLCQDPQTVVITPADLRELVRGCETTLLDNVAPLLREHSVELDLSNVDRIDAAGISALISLYTRARTAGHGFCLRNVSERVAEILNLVGLESVLVSHNAALAPHSDAHFQRSAA